MRVFVLKVATAMVLAFAFPQTPRVWAQGSGSGVASQPLQLDGGPSLGSDQRGQSSGGRSEDAERTGSVSSEKSQTGLGKASETTIRGRSHSRIGLSSQPRHRVVIHRYGRRLFAFHKPTHRFVIHRRGRRVVAETRIAPHT